jgi:hypothetical protein
MNAAEMLKDGWIRNDGVMPVGMNVLVDTKWPVGGFGLNTEARYYIWDMETGPSHWRLHNADCVNPPKSLEDAYDHLNTGNLFGATSVQMSAKNYIKSIQPPVEQPLGLHLSRVCKAFEAITSHPMSEEHAEVFVSVLEMCKGFAQKEGA